MFLVSFQTFSQTTRTWNASGNSNWNLASNWSPVGVPVVGDIAIFDATSNFNCLIDVNIQIDSISMSAGYSGTVTQNTGITLQFDAGANFQGGIFLGGNQAIEINESFTLDGTDFTSTSAMLSILDVDGMAQNVRILSGVFNHNNGEVLLNIVSNPTGVIGDFTFYDLSIIGQYRELDFYHDVLVENDLQLTNTVGSIILDLHDTLTVQGNMTYQGSNFPVTINSGPSDIGTLKFEGSTLSLNASHITGGGSASLYVSGSNPQTIIGPSTPGLCPIPNIKIECNSLTMEGHLTLLGTNWEYLSGTLNYPNPFELVADGTCTILGNSHTLDSLTIIGNFTTTTLSAPLSVNGAFSINPTFTTTLALEAPITLNNSLLLETSTVDDGSNRDIVLNISSNSKLTVNGNLRTTGAHDVTVNTDTLLITGDIDIAHSGTGGGGSGVLELGGINQTIDIDNSLASNEGLFPSIYVNMSGTLDFANPGVFNLTGDWNYEQGVLDLAGSTIAINATNNSGNPIRIAGNPHSFNNLTFNGFHGFLTIEAAITVNGDFTIESDESLATATLTLTDGINVLGNLNTTGSGGLLIETDTLSVQGNLNIKHRELGVGSGAVRINGSGAQLFSGGTQYPEGYLPDIIIDKPGGTLSLEGFITTAGDWSLLDGVVDSQTNGSTLTLANESGAALDLTSPDGNMTLDTLIVDVSRFTGGLQINADLSLRGDLTILDTRSLTTNNHSINIGGSWNNSNTTQDGFNEGSGTVTFDGNVLQSISCPACSSGETFYDLAISNTANAPTFNDLFLADAIQISNSLTLNTGVILTDTDAIVLLANGSSTNLGNTQAYVNGRIAYEKASSGLSTLNFPIGSASHYRPVTLAVNHSSLTSYTYTSAVFNSSADALGYSNGPNVENVSYLRYWTIARNQTGGADSPSADLVGNSTITLSYGMEDEVDDFANLQIAKYDGSSQWENIGGVATGNGVGSITSSSSPVAFTAFSGEFTLANSLAGSNALPVELTSFDVHTSGQDAMLEWVTANEINNSHFEIERSANGQDFQEIWIEPGQGNASHSTQYEYVDKTRKLFPFYFYRISQVDFDGTRELLAVKRAEFGPEVASLSLSYNSQTQQVDISGIEGNEYLISAQVYDLGGNHVEHFSVKDKIALEHFSDQVLILRLSTNLRTQFFRVLKN